MPGESSTTSPTRPPGPHTTSALARDLPLPPTADGVDAIPKLLYGTAWKKERTADLVHEALKAGFRGLDTAAQPRHYREDLVGEGVRRAVAEGIVSRRDLFIQTKFTPVSGQDRDNMPYDPSLPIDAQVRASVTSSLANLSTPDEPTPYIDSLVLHSPLDTDADTLAAWAAMTSFVSSGRVRRLGISNASLAEVSLILLRHPAAAAAAACLPHPAVVQNRFYPHTAYEAPLRALCRERAIVFQAFWVLSGDRGALRRDAPCIRRVADAAAVDRAVAQYALVLALGGISVLDGTTDPEHMRHDVEGIDKVGGWVEDGGDEAAREWAECLAEFKAIVGDDEINQA